MAKPKKRPALTHAKVKQTSQERAPFRVWYSVEDEGGKSRRVFKSFADEEAAWSFAEDKDREISNHGVRYGDIPPEVRRAFDFYRDEKAVLEAAGIAVPRFEDMIAETLTALRREAEKRQESTTTVAEGVALFVHYKEFVQKKKKPKHRQLADIKDRLKRFAQDFGDRPLRSITTTEIDAWLSSLRSRRNPDKLPEPPLLAPLSRNHYRANLHAFFAYGAADQGWVDHNPIADIEPEDVETGEPEAYRPEDVARVMQSALDHKPNLVPVLALGMFAGLRVSEALAVDLGSLDHDADELKVPVSKSGPRLAPFTPACKAWISVTPRRTGKAWLLSARTLVDEMQELFALAKVEQIDNGARHSFISYRCAETRTPGAVADECGNSVVMVKKHYRTLVTAAAAKKYFAIRPPVKRGRKSKVTRIEDGRKLA
jgi:integrase